MTRTSPPADAKAARLAAALRANLRRRKAAPVHPTDDAPPNANGAASGEGLYQATGARPRGRE